jgi:hypothetical protein
VDRSIPPTGIPMAFSSTPLEPAPRHAVAFPGGFRLQAGNLPELMLAGGIAAAVIGRLAMEMITNYFTDDAFFYAVLARNLAAGRGWTFDGVTTTNGAHPLLLGLETLLAWVMGPQVSQIHYYRALAVMFAVVFLAFLAAFAWLMRPSASGERPPFALAAWLSLGILFLPPYVPMISIGMESSLAFPLAAIFFVFWSRGRDRAAGIIGGALVLARLDAFIFVVPFALLRVVSGRGAGDGWGTSLRRAFALLAPMAVVLATYMAFNMALFGSPVPIHGVLKSSFPRVHFQPFQLLGPPGALGTRLLSLHAQALYLSVAAAVLLVRRRRFGDAAGIAILALLVVQVLTQANFTLFQKWSKATPYWYLWQSAFTALLALAIGACEAFPPKAMRAAAVTLGLALGLTGLLDVAHLGVHAVRHRGEAPSFWHTPLIDYLRTQPANETWAATDCGSASFWSERRFVDVDGLIAGTELQDRMARGELGRYLGELGVSRVLVYAWSRPQTTNREYEPMYRSYVNPAAFHGSYDEFPYFVYSYKYLAYSDTLRLRHEQETWRAPQHRDGLGLAREIAYDLRITRGPAGPQAPPYSFAPAASIRFTNSAALTKPSTRAPRASLPSGRRKTTVGSPFTP